MLTEFFRSRVATSVVIVAAVAVLPQCAAEPPALAPPAAAQPTTVASPSPDDAPAPATVHPVTADALGASWHQGCPVEPEELRQIDLSYIGFDGRSHRGQLVVLEELVPEVITIFEQLYQLRYPIEKIRTVDNYPGAEDELSMQDNNTSAFNCRGIEGSDQWSLHAYGRAIDVNPRINPYIGAVGVLPRNATEYVDRSGTDPGLLRAGDPAVRAFTDLGWKWGGYWSSPVDYQHFEKR